MAIYFLYDSDNILFSQIQTRKTIYRQLHETKRKFDNSTVETVDPQNISPISSTICFSVENHKAYQYILKCFFFFEIFLLISQALGSGGHKAWAACPLVTQQVNL